MMSLKVFFLTFLFSVSSPILSESFDSQDQDLKNNYAILCILNKSKTNIEFEWRWKDRPWKTWTLPNFLEVWFSHRLAKGSTYAPKFQIRFDSDPSPHSVYKKTYVLDHNFSQKENCDNGRQFQFRSYDGMIDLYSVF